MHFVFFEITFCLAYLQKHYKFTHNDLHIENIMYTKTKYKYLYYKFNNKYFKDLHMVKFLKIIDYGRSVLNLIIKYILVIVFLNMEKLMDNTVIPLILSHYLIQTIMTILK